MNVNVYEETGTPNASEMLLKAQIVSLVGDVIRSKSMTQTQIAKLSGLTQPQISNILKGRFRDISVEKLMRILTALHHNVRISVDPVPTDTAEIYVEMGAREAANPEKELVPSR